MRTRIFASLAGSVGLISVALFPPQAHAGELSETARSYSASEHRYNETLDPFEVSIGYNYMHLNNSVVDNLHGVDASFFVNFNSWFALGADFIAGFGSETERSFFGNVHFEDNRYVYLFGPRFSIRPSSKWRFFAQALAGGVHGEAEVSLGSSSLTDSADALPQASV